MEKCAVCRHLANHLTLSVEGCRHGGHDGDRRAETDWLFPVTLKEDAHRAYPAAGRERSQERGIFEFRFRCHELSINPHLGLAKQSTEFQHPAVALRVGKRLEAGCEEAPGSSIACQRSPNRDSRPRVHVIAVGFHQGIGLGCETGRGLPTLDALLVAGFGKCWRCGYHLNWDLNFGRREAIGFRAECDGARATFA